MTFKATRDRLYLGKVRVLLIEDVDRIFSTVRKPTPEEKEILEEWAKKWAGPIVWPTLDQAIARTKMAMSSPITQRETEVINLGPCPLKYYGTGKCTCLRCPKTPGKKTNSNPFGY